MIILLTVLIWNVIVYLIYRSDKIRAIKGKRRISEKCLVLCALILGGLGAAVRMYGLRHKTKHIKFKIFVPLGFLITVSAILYIALNLV